MQPRDVNVYRTRYKPRHYYSPIPAAEEVLRVEERIITKPRNLDEADQLMLVNELKPFYTDFPFGQENKNEHLYYPQNVNYFDSDYVFLYCLVQRFRPPRIMGVGSGYCSTLMMNINEMHFHRHWFAINILPGVAKKWEGDGEYMAEKSITCMA